MHREMHSHHQLDEIKPPHDQQEIIANHEYTEALHPKFLSCTTPPSDPSPNIMLPSDPSPMTTTIEDNTTLKYMNTTLQSINTTALHDIDTTLHDTKYTSSCVESDFIDPRSGCDNTTLHDRINTTIETDSMARTSASQRTVLNNINTTHSIESDTTSSFHNTATPYGFPNTTNSMQNTAVSGFLATSNSILCSGIGDTGGMNTGNMDNISGTGNTRNISGIGNSSGFHETTSTVNLDTVIGSKRKRDWMNSLTQPQLTNSRLGMISKGNSSSLLTSVRISNGSVTFPAGWEQYLDLQTGETYYVNWNTRTKHCRVQCPEVQRCLAGAHGIHQEGSHNMNDNNENYNNANSKKKGTIDSWLCKMTEATSALINNQSLIAKKPPLPPIYPLKSSKKSPCLDLTLASITNKKINTLSSIDTPHVPSVYPTIAPSITHDLPSIDSSSLLTINNLPTISNHAMHSLNIFPKQQSYDYTSNSLGIIGLPIPKTCNNSSSISKPQHFDSTSIESVASVCSNCNMHIMISSLATTTSQCPNCNNIVNTWSDGMGDFPRDMSFGPFPLLEASTSTTNL